MTLLTEMSLASELAQENQRDNLLCEAGSARHQHCSGVALLTDGTELHSYFAEVCQIQSIAWTEVDEVRIELNHGNQMEEQIDPNFSK